MNKLNRNIINIESIKQKLLDDNTLGVIPEEKLQLMLSFEHNIKQIIYKICRRINTLHQKQEILLQKI